MEAGIPMKRRKSGRKTGESWQKHVQCEGGQLNLTGGSGEKTINLYRKHVYSVYIFHPSHKDEHFNPNSRVPFRAIFFVIKSPYSYVKHLPSPLITGLKSLSITYPNPVLPVLHAFLPALPS